MKMKRKDIITILKESEAKLQKVIGKAADEGDYTTVEEARLTALAICNIRTNLTISSAQKKEITRKAKKSDYPKFQVKNNELIRIGWSRKQSVEYSHKVPKSVFDTTINVIAQLAQSTTGPVSAETVINRVYEVESDSIPSYQIYVVMGLLKSKDYMKPRGRKGYEIPADIETKAEAEWRKLAG